MEVQTSSVLAESDVGPLTGSNGPDQFFSHPFLTQMDRQAFVETRDGLCLKDEKQDDLVPPEITSMQSLKRPNWASNIGA